MRWRTLLIAFIFAIGASSPCGRTLGGVRTFRSENSVRAHAAQHIGGTPCSAHVPAAVAKAPCPCGCDEHPPGATSLGSLGVALLSLAEAPPEVERAIPTAQTLAAPPAPPARAIEKVPRAA